MATTETHFELDHADDPARRIRGVITLPGEVPTGGAPFVLVVHGFKGFLRWGFFPELCRRVAERGLAAVAFNFSGSGAGQDLQTLDDDAGFEANTYTRELEDIAAVRAAVERHTWGTINPQMGAIFGHSRGGGMALIHAAENPGLRALVTWAAIDSVQRWDPADTALWRTRGFLEVPNARTGQIHRLGVGLLDDAEQNRERLDIPAACQRLRLPALLLHGAADEAVDPGALERLTRSASKDSVHSRLVPGAGHTFGARHPLEALPGDLEQVLEETTAWFADHLLGPAGPRGEPAS